MEMLRQAILQALEDKYNAQISAADATIKIYLESLCWYWRTSTTHRGDR